MCENRSDTLLPRPWFMEGTDQRIHGVPVDTCIAPVVEHLWSKKLVTLGSCCGHGSSLPSFVIEDGAEPGPYWEAINEIDGRQFGLFQWQLVELEALQ